VVEAGFDDGWEDRWAEVKLAGRANRFSAVEEGGTRVLRAESDGAASALWYGLGVGLEDVRVAAWRWKVESSLVENRREREKRGDDYAARFFVIFDGDPFSRSARAICYVWAGSEPEGSEYRNPFFSSVATVVLRSGDERAGEWVREERDFIADYVAAFGRSPDSISAVAVMVDTDNTGSQTAAWFGEIELLSEPRVRATGNTGN
jgi:hypothetical protein